MGYSKDPVKRRRQLEALARSNPSMDIDALMARHEDRSPAGPRDASTAAARDASTDPTAPAGSPEADPQPSKQSHAPHGTGGVLDGRVTDADIDAQAGDLLIVLWQDGADEEHPTIGIPITDEAAIALADAIDRSLGIERDQPADLDVLELRVKDFDRTRWDDGMVARDEEPGRVEVVLTGADGREVTARLCPEHTQFLRRWLKPGWNEAPYEEFAVTADTSTGLVG